MALAKILVVDDDPATEFNPTLFIQAELSSWGCQDGKTTLATFEQFNPDLVILDVNLPDAIGYNLCEEMQTRTRFCPHAD